MDDFSISLDSLEHGWATLTLEDGARSEKYIISDVFYDSLSEIVDSALLLSKGQDSKILFNLEPEEIICRIESQVDGAFLLMVKGTAFQGSAMRYVRQVLKMFDQYKHNYGKGEYLKHWRHAYPSEKLDSLRWSLHTN